MLDFNKIKEVAQGYQADMTASYVPSLRILAKAVMKRRM